METIIIFFSVVILAGLTVLGVFFNLKFKRLGEVGKNDQSMVLIQNQISEITRTLDSKLGESSQMFREQYGQNAQLIGNIMEKLTELRETNRQVITVTDQLKQLQDILKNPKQRGVLGEYYLETLLKNVLPPGSYKMQYKFKNGEIVDAVVFYQDKIIPIDSKFSLENYNRITQESDATERDRLEKVFLNDLKLRIQETAKYIRPEEQTVDYAFMFIPHEAIYYDLLDNKIGAVGGDTESLVRRAASKYRVLIVSPTNFLAYLQTVLQGMKEIQIQEQTKEILKYVALLQKHLNSYDDNLERLGNQLSTTVNSYNTAYREFKKIDKDVIKLVGGESTIEPIQIDKPQRE